VECFTSHAIDLIEAAYDLEKPDAEWLPNVIEVGAPVLDQGQGVDYVLQGDTNKLIAYRLGLSPGRVSGLLKSAMHKLGVKTRAALVEKLGPLGIPLIADDDESAA